MVYGILPILSSFCGQRRKQGERKRESKRKSRGSRPWLSAERLQWKLVEWWRHGAPSTGAVYVGAGSSSSSGASSSLLQCARARRSRCCRGRGTTGAASRSPPRLTQRFPQPLLSGGAHFSSFLYSSDSSHAAAPFSFLFSSSPYAGHSSRSDACSGTPALFGRRVTSARCA
jgi:hypothetical protein